MALPSGDPGQGTMYQAENAVLEGGAYAESSHYNHQGNGYVHVPNTIGAAVNFVVDVNEPGDYIVGMRYAYGEFENNATTDGATNQLPSRASMSIYVNGEKADTLQMDKTSLGWNEYFTGSKRLALKEGQNLIAYIVDNGNTGGINLDYLTMYKADVPYTETEVKPQSITLDKTELTLKEGETAAVTATVLPENALNKSIIFASGDKNIATVDTQGNITAKAEGTAIITAMAEADQNIKAECTVTVEKAQGPQEPEDPQEPENPQHPGNTPVQNQNGDNTNSKGNGISGTNTTAKNNRKAAKTGDNTKIPLAAGTAALALGTTVAIIISRRKRG